ncbi:MAG: hypothetical protein ACJ75G_05110 [Gaiellaceae bacterium]
MSTRRRFSLFVCAAIAAVTITAAPASAHGHFEFHRTSNLNSTLVWVYYPADNPVAHYSPTWRAGSGDSTDCSLIGHGWLPLGWYDTWGQFDHYDSIIKGLAWHLQDKACGDGTLRTELFIHTKELAYYGNSCEDYCFDDGYDYYSNGCIKLSHSGYGFPDDIQTAHWWWHNRDGSTVHGSHTVSNALWVYS